MPSYPRGPKSTWQKQVNDLVAQAEAGGVEAVHALLNWLQNLNWPGAGGIVTMSVSPLQG
ncbi:MAG TPA: hypothetical protein P5081_12310 [Phycisphaerae bacterium]|nr:hypothetical protein [Phycisphaerae bacterium]HRW53659.1 hypothetical protein [Phycisphaerae bacterium]